MAQRFDINAKQNKIIPDIKSTSPTRSKPKPKPTSIPASVTNRSIQRMLFTKPINPVEYETTGPLGSMTTSGGGNRKPGLIPTANASNTLTIATRKCCVSCTELDGPVMYPGVLLQNNEIFGYWGDQYFDQSSPFGEIRPNRCFLSKNHDKTKLFLFYPPTPTYPAGGNVAMVVEGLSSTHENWSKIKAINTKTHKETFLYRNQCREYPSIQQEDGTYLWLYYWWPTPGGSYDPPYYDATVINKNDPFVYFFI